MTRVLEIDDELIFNKITATVLESHGYELEYEKPNAPYLDCWKISLLISAKALTKKPNKKIQQRYG